jgi:adenine-specific DNA-methyltransferase
MTQDYKLVYPSKASTRQIITETPGAELVPVFTFGMADMLTCNWSNMLIFGNNMAVMKTLAETTHIKRNITLVYIDPPFSAQREFRGGNGRVATISASQQDEVAYSDKLIGSEFIEFIRERLVLLHELMADDGSIYVHIDWKKGHYIKVIMDEIFGENHFINDIARIKCNPKNFARRAYGNVKDIVLFYSKTDKYIWNEAKETMTDQDILRRFNKVDAQGRRYTTIPLHAPGETKNGITGQQWNGLTPPKGRHWRTDPQELTRLDKAGLIEWSKTGNPRKIIYADEAIQTGKKRQDIWDFKDYQYPTYPTEKNADMLKVIIEASSNPGDIVLDCFAGSGTTLVSAEEFGRRWIGIDNSPLAIETTISKITALKKPSVFTLYNATNKPLTERLQEVIQKKCA